MSVSPAERDSKREQAFALAMQKVPYREIARQLGINKSTVVEYVRIERKRRSHDRNAEYIIRDVVSILRASLLEMLVQLRMTEGTGSHTTYAKAKIGESIRRTARDLVVDYGVKLPKVDGEEIAMDRLMEMVQQELDTPVTGYPDVSEDAIFENYLKPPAEIDREYREWKQEQKRVGEEWLQQREYLREAERRLHEEAERRGLSLEDILNSEEYDEFDAIDASEILDAHYGSTEEH